MVPGTFYVVLPGAELYSLNSLFVSEFGKELARQGPRAFVANNMKTLGTALRGAELQRL